MKTPEEKHLVEVEINKNIRPSCYGRYNVYNLIKNKFVLII